MTGEEFEEQYARQSGLTVELLRDFRVVRPCECGQEGCPGWQSLSFEAAAEYDRQRAP